MEAIRLTENANNVFVLSIPDWGVTPFASDKDVKKIAEEIDVYNNACVAIASSENVTFIDITSSQRIDGVETSFLASDGLHPSAKEYAKWAHHLKSAILKINLPGI